MDERRRTDALPPRIDHEFRTPITLVLAHLEAAMGGGSEGAVRDDMRAAHRNALRLLHLVDGLIALSRNDEGRLRPRLSAVDLHGRTQALVDGFREATEKAGLTLSLDGTPTGRIQVDPEMWDRIVLNLLSNALKFTFEGGIRVRIQGNADEIELEVADDGIGVDAGELRHVFDRSYEGGSGRQGAGIGLAVVKSMVDAMQGRIEASSTVGSGTTFVVRIPTDLEERLGPGVPKPSSGRDAVEAHVADALRWVPSVGDGDDQTTRAAGLRLQRPRAFALPVLGVVDASPDMRQLVQRIVGDRYEVRGFDTAIDALAIEADLYLVSDDIGVDGLRAIAAGTDSPKILMIDRSRMEAGEIWQDADDFLVRPFSAVELLARARNLLQQSRLRKDAEDALRQAQRMEAIGKLAGGVSHDFSNLLVAALGNLDMALRHAQDERTTRYVSNARRAAERGAKLTRHLLAFSQRREGSTETVNVNDAISSMGEFVSRTLGGMIGVNLRLGKGIWPTSVDPGQFELAVLNLALNARDAMPAGGDLTIATANVEGGSKGDFVRITVADSGVGMDDETVSRAADRFFSTKDGSAGLGLTQVAEMAERSGGRVEIVSSPGRGATVDILLPRSEPEATAEPLTLLPPSEAEPIKILLVDDDNGVRDVATALLMEMGHDVTQAIGGREAIAHLERASFDLLLVDYAMPDMTGVEVSVRARAMQPGIKVLFATGYADAGVLDEREEIVLRKPFDMEALAAKVGKAMSVGGSVARAPGVLSLSDYRRVAAD